VPELNASVRIDRPLEDVFAFVDDHRNVTRYLKHLERWDPVDPARVQGLGIRFRGVVRAGPVALRGVLEVTEHVPGEKVSYRSVEGPKLSGEWTFHRDGDGTVVKLRNTYDLPGGAVGRMVGRVISTQGERELEGSLRELKRLVESET
jgi:uncharacterized membrane protein